MKAYLYVNLIAAFIAYVMTAVFNQQGDAWNDWRLHADSFWCASVIIWGFHLYSKSKYKSWKLDLLFIFCISFALLNFFYAVTTIGQWATTDKTMQYILAQKFELYNCFYLLTSGTCGIMIGLVYLINYPYIVYGNKEG